MEINLFALSLIFHPRARGACSFSPLPEAIRRRTPLRSSSTSGFWLPRDNRARGKAAPWYHLVVTRSRRHEQRRKEKIEDAHFSLHLSPSLSQTLHSAVAPRRGALVVVANSKKTDIKKQGLNSIKVRNEKESKKQRSPCVVVEGKREPNSSRPLLTLLSFTLALFLFPPSLFSQPKKKQNDVVKANLMGISRKMKDKDWTDSQGRKGKGYGVYRFADKYGVRRRNFLSFTLFFSLFFSFRLDPFSAPFFSFYSPFSSSETPLITGQRRRLLPDLHPGHLVRVRRFLQARHEGAGRLGWSHRGAARRRRQPDHLDQPDRLLD